MSRVLVYERRLVAVVLAGEAFEGVAGELVDDELRAVLVAVLALRAWRRPPTDEDLEVLVRAQGAALADLEQLRREGAMRRAA